MKYNEWLRVFETSEKIDSVIAVLGTYTEQAINNENKSQESLNHISIMLSSLKDETFSLKEDIQKITVKK